MVKRAEDWMSNSLGRWLHPTEHREKPILCPWPIAQPRQLGHASEPSPDRKKEREALQASVVGGRPFGSKSWQEATAKQLGLESTFRSRGRPIKTINGSNPWHYWTAPLVRPSPPATLD